MINMPKHLGDIKFYLNKGRRCAQIAIKSVATGDSVSLRELDNLTGREENQITTPVQIAYCLYKLGVNFIYPVKPFFLRCSITNFDNKYLRLFGENNIKRTNFEFIEKARRELIKAKKYLLKEKLDLKDTIDFLGEKLTPICLINYDRFVQRDDQRNGHYLIVREIDEEIARVMDSGPCNADPNRKISRRRLENSLMETPIDYGIIYV